MRKCFVFALIMATLLSLEPQDLRAEQFTSVYDLGDNYTLNFGSKSVDLHRNRNIVGLNKSDIATKGDAMVFTLNKPYYDFGGDGASLGVVYTKPLKENMIGALSLTGGPDDGALSTPDIAITFHIKIKLQ